MDLKDEVIIFNRWEFFDWYRPLQIEIRNDHPDELSILDLFNMMEKK
jgi:hypothetical protein